jgi:cytochrome c oxidase subunit 4
MTPAERHFSDAPHAHPGHGAFDPAGHGHDHSGVGKYLVVFVALCVLTGMSFFTYSDFWRSRLAPEVGWAFMIAVACTKAALVIMFFMHLKYEKSWKYVLTIPTAMMAVFLVLMLVPDVGRRARNYSEERARQAAEPKADRPHGGAEHGGEPGEAGERAAAH